MKSDASAPTRKAVVIGGGPAGLTAAYELTRHGVTPVVLEKGERVGGIARTENYKGYFFDMGGHRFFTKAREVNDLWREVLQEDFLRRPRLSRIYFRGRFFHYPLKPANVLRSLGLVESLLIMLSYLRWQILPHRQEQTFEEWVTNRFGRRLFLMFFKTYTEKVWGISCSELKAEWAAQRIKDLSVRTILLSMLIKPGRKIKTLIEEFDYPRQGPGMMWEAFARIVNDRGGEVRLHADVVRLKRCGARIESVEVRQGAEIEQLAGSDFISSMPLTELVQKLDPPAPAEVLEASHHLSYRDFLTVCLIIRQPDLFPDNWIYIHEPGVKVGRIQNFKNWSPDTVPDPSTSSLGLEYFCNEGDELWCTPDAELIELAKKEVAQIGLACAEDVVDGCVCRVPKAYPVYDADYGQYLTTLREFVAGIENLQTIGRNGLHRYNNQDHAMLTGLYAVRNLLLGEAHDLWNVNADQEYHEEQRVDSAQAAAPTPESAPVPVFGRVHRLGLGIALATVLGLTLGVLTSIGSAAHSAGYNAWLYGMLGWLPGYRVSLAGSMEAFIGGAGGGFLFGWGAAIVRNGLAALTSPEMRTLLAGAPLNEILDLI